MKVKLGFPPRLDCLSVQEKNTKVYLRTHRHRINIEVIENHETVVSEWVPLTVLVEALKTIPPQPE
jgi:hypothetical protein